MTQSQPAKEPVRFTQTLTFEVERLPFIPMESLKHLDVEALSRAEQTEIEVGYYDTGCHQFVRAVIKRGMVTALKVDPCEEFREPPAELRELFDKAVRRLRPRRPRDWQPMPVRQFLSNMEQQVQIDVITCFRICWMFFCFYCCTTLNDENPFMCSDRLILPQPETPRSPD